MSTPAQIHRFDDNHYQPVDVKVVDECAVAIEFNGISHAVMMATPTDLEDFALGFSLSEGIVESSDQVYAMELSQSPHGWTVGIEIAGEPFDRIKQRRRQMTGRSGCGLCGTESLEHAIRPVQQVAAVTPSAKAVNHASSSLKANQIQAQETGAMHAAAWCNMDGEIQLIREDVGRHNALDKLIGALDGQSKAGFALVSSRASYEMVHKSCAAGFGALVAVSAPTSMAVKMAAQAGITLIGLAKGQTHNIYGTSR